MEQLRDGKVDSELCYDVDTEFVAEENGVEHVVRVFGIQRHGILWRHFVEIVDDKFAKMWL